MPVQAGAVARVLGIEETFVDLRDGAVQFLPMQIGVIGQGTSDASYSTDPVTVNSASEVGKQFGFGSPLHLAVRELFPTSGRGVGIIPVKIFPVEEDSGATPSSGDISFDGEATENASVQILVNNIASERITVEEGDTDADIAPKVEDAINAVLEIPVTASEDAGTVTVESKWAGDSANDIVLDVEGEADGVEFVFTQPDGGATNPDIQPALDEIGDRWITLIVNTLNPGDDDALDKLEAAGEGRWDPLKRRPFVAVVGNNAVEVSDATQHTEDRQETDRVNCQLTAPGSDDLPLTIASAQLVRIARVANDNPPHDYGSQQVTRITPGRERDQWDYAERDQAVKDGTSTIEVRNGVVHISDVVTPLAPEGEPIPPYRFVVDIIKVMNIVYNTDLVFNRPEWDGAPLIPDDQPTTNRDAKRPKDAKAAVASLIDSLGENAIIADPEGAKETIQANIDSQNPKRLNVLYQAALSGNTNIRAVTFEFGFLFG